MEVTMLQVTVVVVLVVLGPASGILYGSITMCRGACSIYGKCEFDAPSLKYECVCHNPDLVFTGGACQACPVPCRKGHCELTQGGGARCVCPQGMVLVRGECVDARGECQLNCLNGQCRAVNGAWRCFCPEGTLLAQGVCRQCPVPCGGGQCQVRPDGSALCQCPFGSTLVNGQCISKRELCEKSCSNGYCSSNWNGFWSCNCPRDSVLVNGVCLERRLLCQNDCVNGACQQTPLGNWVCRCPPGFQLRGRVCEDINECTQPFYCANGRCINFPGTFRCQCDQGFEPSFDGKTCKRIVYPCVCNGGYCRTVGGVNQCTCPNGFVLVGTSTCKEKRLLCQNDCINGACQQSALGNWVCRCPPGFELRGRVCEDINECSQPFYCTNGRCINLPGTFRCQCDQGFEPSFDSKSCKRIVYPCVCNGGYCRNMGGVNRCTCPYGYMLEGSTTCKDINECVSDPCLGGGCQNYPGGHTCGQCLPGFILSPDAKRCLPVTITSVRVPRRGRFVPWWFYMMDA